MSKVLPLAEALRRHVPDGASVALGTALECLIPFAAAHELIRQERRDLTLVGPISDICFEQLIAAGCVRRVVAAWVGNVQHGAAYAFRRALEQGVPRPLEIEDHSNFSIALALEAAAQGVPYLPTRSLLGSDLLARNPRLRVAPCPFTGVPLVLVPALAPDVAILHVQRADADGNCHAWGPTGVSAAAGKASRAVIVVAEELVEPSRHPERSEPDARARIPGDGRRPPAGRAPTRRPSRATTTATTRSTRTGTRARRPRRARRPGSTSGCETLAITPATSRSSAGPVSIGSGLARPGSRRPSTTGADEGPPRDPGLHAGRAHGGRRRSRDPGRRGRVRGHAAPAARVLPGPVDPRAERGGSLRERRRPRLARARVPGDHVGRPQRDRSRLVHRDARGDGSHAGGTGDARLHRRRPGGPLRQPQHHVRRPAGAGPPLARVRRRARHRLARAPPRRDHGARAPAVRGAGRLRDVTGPRRGRRLAGADRAARRRPVGRHHHARALPLRPGDPGDGARERAPGRDRGGGPGRDGLAAPVRSLRWSRRRRRAPTSWR